MLRLGLLCGGLLVYYEVLIRIGMERSRPLLALRDHGLILIGDRCTGIHCKMKKENVLQISFAFVISPAGLVKNRFVVFQVRYWSLNQPNHVRAGSLETQSHRL